MVDALILKTLVAADKVARYRHAQHAVPDNAPLDELIVQIKSDLVTLSPLLDLEPSAPARQINTEPTTRLRKLPNTAY